MFSDKINIEKKDILAQILDLFAVNYDQLNNNADLIFDKLEYIFLQMPLVDENKI